MTAEGRYKVSARGTREGFAQVSSQPSDLSLLQHFMWQAPPSSLIHLCVYAPESGGQLPRRQHSCSPGAHTGSHVACQGHKPMPSRAWQAREMREMCLLEHRVLWVCHLFSGDLGSENRTNCQGDLGGSRTLSGMGAGSCGGRCSGQQERRYMCPASHTSPQSHRESRPQATHLLSFPNTLEMRTLL